MKKIKNIVLYSFNQNDIYTEQACIFYNDGDVESVSKERGIELISKFAQQNNIKNMAELKNNEHIKILSEEEFKENYDNILNDSKDDNENIDLLTNSENKKKKNGSRKLWFTLKLGLGIGIVVLGAKVVKSIYDIDSPTEKYKLDKTKNTNDDLNIQNDNKTGKLLNDNTLNEEKRIFITKAWSYLNQYNNDFSFLHFSENSTTKLSLTWDEAIVEELIYNNIDKNDLTQIFDSYDFNAEDMYKAYLKSISQETKAHIVQTTPLNKTLIFNNDKEKSFYEKYEIMMINFNNETNDNIKEEIANNFYLSLRNDFNLDSKNIDSIQSYKLSIIPIINAMNTECNNIDKPYLLTEEENDFFNKKLTKKVAKKKLENYATILNTYAIANRALDSNIISFEKIKIAAIEDLQKNNSYNIEENQRDISDHEEYINRINWEYKEKTNTNTNIANSENNNNNNNNIKTNNDNDKKQKKNKKHNKKVKSSTVPTLNNIEENQPISEDNNYQTASPIPINIDDNPPDDVDINVNEETPTSFEEDQPTEEPIIENTPTPTSDNSIKDITTDPTGAVDKNEPLPDPNNITKKSLTNEELANIIIDQMENQEDTNKYTKNYVK